MKIKILFLSLSLMLILSECKNSKEINHENIKSINIYPKEGLLRFSDYFSNVEVFQVKDTILGNMKRIFQVGNKLIIEAKSGKYLVHIFNLGTQEIKSIAEIGDAPNQFIDVRDVKCYNDRIEILDFMRKRITQYNLNGEFTKYINLPDYCESFETIDSSKFVIYKEVTATNKNEYMVNIFSSGEQDIINKFIQIDPILSVERSFSQPTSLYKINDNLMFFKTFNDTIYNIKDDNLYPMYAFNSGNLKLPGDWIKNKTWTLIDFVEKCKTSNFIWNINYLYESNEYLNFMFKYKGDVYLSFYNKILTNCESFKTINDDIFSQYNGTLTEDFKIVGGTNDALFFVIEPYWFKETLEKFKDSLKPKDWEEFIKKHTEIKSTLDSLKLTDNQIILKFMYKKL